MKRPPKIVTVQRQQHRARVAAEALVVAGLSSPRSGRPDESPLVRVRQIEKIRTASVSTDKANSDHSPVNDASVLELMATKGISLNLALFDGKSNTRSIPQLKQTTAVVPAKALNSVLSHWETKDAIGKLLLSASAMDRPGRSPVAVTVNFGEQRQGLLSDSNERLARLLRNDLARIGELGTFMGVFEFTDDGRLHFHGLLDSAKDLKTIRAQLRKLGGRSRSVAFTNCFQVNARTCRSAIGWAAYMLKDLPVDMDRNVSEMIYLSHAAKRGGRDHLNWLKQVACPRLGLSVSAGMRTRSGLLSVAFAA